MSGELNKMTIYAFLDKKFKKSVGEFEIPINPEKYSRQFRLKYDLEQARGSEGNDPKYEGTEPEELRLDFVFDGTGVVPIPGADKKFQTDVKAQVKDFKKIVYKLEGESHKPKYLKIIWSKDHLVFECVLKDLTIDYTLFNPDGSPLRARLSATFLQYIEAGKRLRTENKRSPDLTHIRSTIEGDTLPLMSYRIYDGTDLYLQVARFNGLTNFRRLSTSTDLVFPPIDKSN